MLFLAQQLPLLSKSHSTPACLSVMSLYQREAWNELLSLDKLLSQTTHTHTHKQNTHSRENKTMLRDLFQQLSEWLTVSPSVLQFQQMALFVCICTVTQKDNSSVCAWGDYNIPLLFLPYSQANPGLLTLQSSKITQTHKKTQTHYTQGAWESFWLLQEWREGF